jgi:gliding motility-associated-like protein
MKSNYYSLLWLCIFHFTPVSAQTGREFWFAAPEVTSLHADRPINLYISTFDKPSAVTISQPANPSFPLISRSIPAKSTVIIDLTPQIDLVETKPANKVLNTGLLIQSSQDVSIYYEVDGSNDQDQIVNTDIFVLKGNNALGDTFFIPMQTYWDNYNDADIEAWASFDIIATSANTHVTIFPTNRIFGHTSTAPFTILLNKGQTYSVRALSPLGINRPTGSRVISDKPIAITLKDDSMFDDADLSNNFGNWDLSGDQLVSTKDIGTEYIAIKGSSIFNQDKIAFTGTQDSTYLFTGKDTLKLASGKTVMYSLTDSAHYFRSSAPIYAFHISAFEYELGGALLPPLACTGTKELIFVRSNEEQFAINVVVKAGGENNFLVNGSASVLRPSYFRNVPGTNGEWKYTHYPFNAQVGIPYRVKNTTHDFHLSVMNGGDVTGFRYGYFSGFGSVNLGPDKFFCQGDSVTIDAGIGKDSYLWSTGDTTSSIRVNKIDTIWVQVTKGVCAFRDTVTIGQYPPITQDVLGSDTAACLHVPFTITTLHSFRTYLWEDGSTKPTYQPLFTGEHSVFVTDSNHCGKKDSLHFTQYVLPQPNILYNQKAEEFCNDSLVSLSVPEVYTSYAWFDGQKEQSIVTPHTGDNHYSVKVVDSHHCEGQTSVAIDCSPYITIPNVFTPNGDGVNESFRIKNVEYADWELEIYNRWGKRVWHASPYQNDWHADGLPDGIYFYTLHNATLQTTYKGWVQVLR